jgi:hypothetical protein
LSQRQIALSCQIGQATVSDYLRMATAAGLKWPDIADWDEDRLRSALAPASVPAPSWRKTDDPDFAEIRRELQTHKHLTLQLLWEEYRQQQPNGHLPTETSSRRSRLPRERQLTAFPLLSRRSRPGPKEMGKTAPKNGSNGSEWGYSQ